MQVPTGSRPDIKDMKQNTFQKPMLEILKSSLILNNVSDCSHLDSVLKL